MTYDTDQYEEVLPEDTDLWGDDDNIGSDDLGEVDELSQEFVDKLVDKVMTFGEVLNGNKLHSYQEPFARRIVESVIINDGSELTALASRQSGKALDIETPMLTANRGWTTMGDLQTGDSVYAPDGAVTEILMAHPVHHTDAFRVTLTDGRSLVASGNHLWGVYDYGDKYKVLNTYQLLEEGLSKAHTTTTDGVQYAGKEYRFRLPGQSAVDSPNVELPIDPYYLGYWLGDGHSYSTFITCHRDDAPSLSAALPYPHEVVFEDKRNTDTATLKMQVKGMTKEMHDLGLLSYNKGDVCRKHIPTEYLAAGTEQRLALLRGLMDSDGCVTRTKTASRCEFTSVKKEIAQNVLTLALSLGYRATLIEGVATLNGREVSPKYRVCFSVFHDDPNPFHLTRKADNVVLAKWRKRPSITSIERVEDRPTRCITVDHPDALFLAGSELVPTHNTEITAFVVSTLMVLLPRLALMFPDLLGKFKDGFWVGMFAPVETMAETLYGRTISRLTSERAIEILGDPEIDDITTRTPGVTKGMKLQKSGSSLLMMTANPRAKIESKSFHLIIIDECFPYDTPVLTSAGWLRIGEIVEGERMDVLVATQDTDGKMTYAQITSAYRTPRHTELVRVVHEHGSVLCTANHPFVVGDARVPAIDLSPGAPLLLVPQQDQPTGGEASEEADYRSVLTGLLARDGEVPPGGEGELREGWPSGTRRGQGSEPSGVPAHEGQQPNAQPRDQIQGGTDPAPDWAPPQGAGRKWTRDDRATAEALAGTRRGMGSRVCTPHWRRESEGGTSDALQDRHREPGAEDCSGDRWLLPRDSGEASAGPAQGAIPTVSRVVRVEVLEPGDPDWDRLGDRVDYVYTLGVASESHTYVAAGILVGNCQDTDDFVVSKSISPMGAYYNATIVKTGTPTTSKNNFYKAIQLNKRLSTGRGARQNHFQWDWREVSKVNPNYEKFIKKEMIRIGEDSDEFQLSYNCVAPHTMILTSDLRHVRADSLKVGDRLVGFDEERQSKGSHRKFREATVTNTKIVSKPGYRTTLSDGTVVETSEDHQWLVSTAGRRTVWKAAKDLTATDRIFKVSDVWEHTADYETGLLSAAFSGEGHLLIRRGNCGFSQRNNSFMAEVQSALLAKGFSFSQYDGGGAHLDVSRTQLSGGRAAVLRFLGEIRPSRLLDSFKPDDIGSIGRHDFKATGFSHPLVVENVPIGEIDVVALETDTRTYVAEGLASHNCRWLLERGMFVNSSVLDHTNPMTLGDVTMETVKLWQASPVIVGIDPARKSDSTVVTVIWVDWDRPDEFGFYEHRVLNWLELQGDDWEEQYFQILNFLANYDVLAVAVDGNGVGDAVAQRLQVLMPNTEVVAVTSSPSEQSARYKHLQTLIQRRLLSWPAHAKTRRLRSYRRFVQQMGDAELNFKGPNLVVEAPDEAHAHDDYVDSLSLACSVTKDLTMPNVEVSNNFLMGS